MELFFELWIHRGIPRLTLNIWSSLHPVDVLLLAFVEFLHAILT